MAKPVVCPARPVDVQDAAPCHCHLATARFGVPSSYSCLQDHSGVQTAPPSACAQRFGQGNALRKTIFELIAAELLKTVPLPTPDPTVHLQLSQHGSGHGPSFIRWVCPHLDRKP